MFDSPTMADLDPNVLADLDPNVLADLDSNVLHVFGMDEQVIGPTIIDPSINILDPPLLSLPSICPCRVDVR